MIIPFQVETLANSLSLEFRDLSNRYFGDYWHLCVEVRCRVPVQGCGLSPEELARARDALGDAVEYVRRLERMGVPTDAVADARSAMVESFLAGARPYLESPSFAARLVAGRLREKRLARRPFPVS